MEINDLVKKINISIKTKNFKDLELYWECLELLTSNYFDNIVNNFQNSNCSVTKKYTILHNKCCELNNKILKFYINELTNNLKII
jgi:hypothetical protein